jgi:hypothetical protein
MIGYGTMHTPLIQGGIQFPEILRLKAREQTTPAAIQMSTVLVGGIYPAAGFSGVGPATAPVSKARNLGLHFPLWNKW